MAERYAEFTTIELLEKLHPRAKAAYENLFDAFAKDTPVFVPMTIAALAINSVLSKAVREEGVRDDSRMMRLKNELEHFLGAAFITVDSESKND